MGLENRDWYREGPKRRRSPSLSLPVGLLIVVGVVAGLVVAGVFRNKLQGKAAVYGGEHGSHVGATEILSLPGLPGVKIGAEGLYAKNDP